MKIVLACPAPPRSRKGNRVTAVRWAGFLKSLGHRVTIAADCDGRPCDLLIALHARKSYDAARAYRAASPDGPLVVALTGTDLYRDVRTSATARRSLDMADRLVVLQPKALDELAPRLRGKTRVILQSAKPTPNPPSAATWGPNFFPVCVLGHLRHEKDPFRAALALRLLPRDTRVFLVQAGEALSEPMAERARTLMRRLPRYQWLGEVSGLGARRVLASSRLMVLSSRMEGGANVISEALADGVPVLASRIPGNVGLLGARYPGYFPVGATKALARLLARAEGDAAFYARLKAWCAGLAPRVAPERECAAWARLLDEFGAAGVG